ncbi:MAG: ribosomal protein S13 [Candidatus Binatia bacterium]|jgi:ribosomal protein S13
MSLFNSWKIILALAAIFGAGAYTGHIVTKGAVKPEVEKRADLDDYTHRTIAKLQKELKLTAEQEMRIEESVEKAGRQLKQEYADTLTRIVAILDEASQEIRPELNEEQEVKYDKMLNEAKAQIQLRIESQ